MVYSHEIINYPDNLPLNLFIHTIGIVEKHWHQSLELLIVIEGSVTILTGNERTILEVDDVYLVNANQIHDLYAENATIIAIQIKPELLKNVPSEFKTTHYTCDSTRDVEPARFATIRTIVAKLLKLNLDGGKYIRLMNESLFYNLIYELYANFADGMLVNQEEAFKQLDRLNKILVLINSEYDQKLSLENIAERVFVSPQYLSKFFKQSMGISLSDHIKATRLHYTTNDLLHFDSSIEVIARNNGFPNTRSFVKAFKEKYNILPSDWRANNTTDPKEFIPQNKDKSISYYESDSVTMHRSLSQFIDTHLSSGADTVTPVKQVADSTHVITLSKESDYTYDCKRFIGVSRVKELLYDAVRKQLNEVQHNMRFDFIKMHSILDDDLFVYTEDGDGNPIYNFNLIDQIFDFLISIGLKPLIQLSFMPELLAANKNKRLFLKKTIISEPNDIKKWCALVRQLVNHLLNRYTHDTVKTWLFSVWNEPGTSNNLFGLNSDEAYYNLYKSTYDTVKDISGELSFGGPAGFSAYGKNDDWLLNFLKYANHANCRPDFITIHYYDIDLSDEFFRKRKFQNMLWLSPDPDSFVNHINILNHQLKEIGYGDTPLYVTEWNSTTSHKDLLSDTCFKSAYIAKNASKISSGVNGLCYWLLTDLHEENQLGPQIFHGGLGLFTVNGIRKPSYYALLFMSRLGKKAIYRSDGIIVTENGDDTVVLLYNYHHYSLTYARDIGINVSYTERYSAFPDKGRKNIVLEFSHLSGKFLVTEQYVNRSHGSAYDNFIKMGAIEPMANEDRDFLLNISVPQIKKNYHTAFPLKLSVSLGAFEVRLINIRPIIE